MSILAPISLQYAIANQKKIPVTASASDNSNAIPTAKIGKAASNHATPNIAADKMNYDSETIQGEWHPPLFIGDELLLQVIWIPIFPERRLPLFFVLRFQRQTDFAVQKIQKDFRLRFRNRAWIEMQID